MGPFTDMYEIAKEFGFGVALSVAAAAMIGWLFRAGTVNAVRALGDTITAMRELSKEQTVDNNQLRLEVQRLRVENGLLYAQIAALREEVHQLQRDAK